MRCLHFQLLIVWLLKFWYQTSESTGKQLVCLCCHRHLCSRISLVYCCVNARLAKCIRSGLLHVVSRACTCFICCCRWQWCFNFENIGLEHLFDGFGVLVSMRDPVARWINDSNFFPIACRMGRDSLLAFLGFCHEPKVYWSCVYLKDSFFLNQ